MSECDAESLSALLDNEADDLSIPRVLESYEENPDIAEKWRRYNLVQAAIHDDVVQVSPNLRKGILESVKEKNNPDRFEISVFGDQLLKIAIAASVATICVLSGKFIFEDTGIGTQIADQRLISTDNSELISPFNKSEDRSEAELKAQELLKEYISRIQIDEEAPPLTEHLHNSPLYRLVNQIESRDN
ncbi:MAG: sigma-E factor negative regulatory protein [Pseudohongiellaceae bacterium]